MINLDNLFWLLVGVVLGLFCLLADGSTIL
jgi:hypothetical protein